MTPTDLPTKDGAARPSYADPTPNPFVIVSDRSPELMGIVLVSCALTVAFTRLFLELTGYPQIGNSTFHIAHALWGGLALFLAGVMVLIVQNRGSAAVVALLIGVGFRIVCRRGGEVHQQAERLFLSTGRADHLCLATHDLAVHRAGATTSVA